MTALVAINNDSDDEIKFRWRVSSEDAFVVINPMEGVIPKQGHLLCRLFLKTLQKARIHDFVIECHTHTVATLVSLNAVAR